MLLNTSRIGIFVLHNTARRLSSKDVCIEKQEVKNEQTMKALSSPQSDCVNGTNTIDYSTEVIHSAGEDVDSKLHQGLSDESSLPNETSGKFRKEYLSLPTVSLPPELQEAVDTLLSRYPRKSLIHDGESLSRYLATRKSPSTVLKIKHHKEKGNTPAKDEHLWEEEKTKTHFQPALRYGRREGVAYAASRIQASYGVTLRVLSEIAQRTKGSFKPATLLDFGSGLGTVEWAAHRLWGDTIYEYQCVDTSQEMGDLAEMLRTGGRETETEVLTSQSDGKDLISGTYFKQYLPASNKIQYDLVVSSYTMGDMPTVRLKKQAVASLWRKTKEFLILIEPGTWSGFQTILGARDMILYESQSWSKYKGETSEELEGHVFAPCPHDMSCPLSPTLSHKPRRPCHFAQRVQLAFCEKGGPLRHKGFRIENFCYVILKKGPKHIGNDSLSEARILQPTKKRSRHVICNLCMPNGEATQVILTKSKHKEQYRKARCSKWGDLLPIYSQLKAGKS